MTDIKPSDDNNTEYSRVLHGYIASIATREADSTEILELLAHEKKINFKGLLMYLARHGSENNWKENTTLNRFYLCRTEIEQATKNKEPLDQIGESKHQYRYAEPINAKRYIEEYFAEKPDSETVSIIDEISNYVTNLVEGKEQITDSDAYNSLLIYFIVVLNINLKMLSDTTRDKYCWYKEGRAKIKVNGNEVETSVLAYRAWDILVRNNDGPISDVEKAPLLGTKKDTAKFRALNSYVKHIERSYKAGEFINKVALKTKPNNVDAFKVKLKATNLLDEVFAKYVESQQ